MNAQATVAKQIIICDDDDDILCFLGVLMQQSGYMPLLARNMSDIIPYLRDGDPKLMLLDIRMPETDGFEIAETLRRNGITIPIIFITAHDNTFCRVYSPTVGAAGYFTKPLNSDALLQRIEELVTAA